MNKRTLLIIVGILFALLAFGCASKKSDPAPHKQSDYVGTYDFFVNVHKVRFIVRSNFSVDNGIIDGNASDVTIQMGTDNIVQVEISNQPLNLDFVISNIHYVGNTVQGQVDGSTITLTKY